MRRVAGVASQALARDFYIGDRLIDIDGFEVTRLAHVDQALFDSQRTAGAQVALFKKRQSCLL